MSNINIILYIYMSKAIRNEIEKGIGAVRDKIEDGIKDFAKKKLGF